MMITSQNSEFPDWALSRSDQPLSDEHLKFWKTFSDVMILCLFVVGISNFCKSSSLIEDETDIKFIQFPEPNMVIGLFVTLSEYSHFVCLVRRLLRGVDHTGHRKYGCHLC